MNAPHPVWTIAVVVLVTVALRFLPFLVLGGQKQTPPFITYLGKVLPFAIMGMLVVYCLKSVSLVQAPFGIPEFIASAIVIALHLWKRNTLISITVGTIAYMILVQIVF